MSADLLRQLSGWLSSTDVDWLELRGPGVHLCLRNEGQQVEALPVRATSVGRFLHAHPLHDAPLATPGRRVARGQTIGLLQVGALLLPVQAPHDGTVTGHVAADGTIVGFGAPLIDLSAAAPG